jgi:hypothetical protein
MLAGFKCFVVGPNCSIENLKGHFLSVGGNSGKAEEVIHITKYTLTGEDSYSIPDPSQ